MNQRTIPEGQVFRVFVPMDNNQQDGYPTLNHPDGYVFLIQISNSL